MTDSLDLDAYLARIGYAGPREPTLAVLQDLHLRHPRAIPFENLDVLMKRPVRIDLGSIQAKLVAGQRGGYCFEHNTLFKAVLEALGFRVTGLAARVQWMTPEGFVGPRTHMLLRVDLPEGPYMADVGFGGMVKTRPLPLHAGAELDTGLGVFRLVGVGEELQLQAELPDGWTPIYQFSPEPQQPIDYVLANWFVSTHPDSPFVGNLMSAWIGDGRRYGVRNNQVSIHIPGQPSEKQVLDAAGIAALMHDTFGIARPEGDDAETLAAVYRRLAEG